MSNQMLQRLTADMKTAMRTGDKARLAVLRLLISDLKESQHQAGVDALADDAELAVLRRAVKTRRETVEQAQQSGRDEIAARELAEIAVIEEYLPTMLSGEALQREVAALAREIGFGGPADKGKFMKAWMARYAGRAEGRAVQEALNSL